MYDKKTLENLRRELEGLERALKPRRTQSSNKKVEKHMKRLGRIELELLSQEWF